VRDAYFFSKEQFSLLVKDSSLDFPSSPRLVPDLGTYSVPHGLGVFIRGVGADFVLRGRGIERAYEYLKSVLDGLLRWEDIVEGRPDDVPINHVLQTLWLLFQHGLLVNGTKNSVAQSVPFDIASKRQLLFWGRHLSVTGSLNNEHQAHELIRRSSVIVVANGLVGAITVDLLSRSGLQAIQLIYPDDPGLLGQNEKRFTLLYPKVGVVNPPGEQFVNEVLGLVSDFAVGTDLIVAVGVELDPRLLGGLNQIALSTQTPLLCANIVGSQLRFGPFVDAISAACNQCAELRRRATNSLRIEEELFERFLHGDDSENRKALESARNILVGETIANATLSGGMVTAEVVRILTKIAVPLTLNARIHVELLEGDIQRHTILPVPGCDHCSREYLCSLPGNAAAVGSTEM
jgi:bacteriocin biosynthesis cyclodehydratase domain-containing protein